MVQGKIYCAEQITVPEKYPNILKTYAKAVIRTQPYDLLRWSAAYFRCLASNVPPPVKVRLEKESKFGKLTKGYLRVLLEQIGKGYYVQRETLQHRWASLSLPEDELLKFLSLCRMFHWSQIHWLELFAVMVGSLNDNFHSTVQMMCELLTDDPEGGPNSVPIWMFNVCYSFIAKLDCSETQTFLKGRKVLGKDIIEDLNKEPDPPKIYSLDLFRYALIERFIQKEHQKLHQETNEKEMSEISSYESVDTNYSDVSTSFNFVGLSDPEGVIRRTKDFRSIIVLLNEGQREALRNFNNEDTRNKVIQHLLIEKKSMKHFESEKDNVSTTSLAGSFCSTVRSDISSSFKFIGDFKNPYEVIKKTPNIDDVLLILSKQQRNTLRNFTERQTTDQRVKEELFRDISRTDETSQYATDKSEVTDRTNCTDLSKGLEPPWSWIYQFASTKQVEQSYNFIECDSIPTNETPTILTDGSFDFARGQFREGSVSDQATISEDEQKENLQMVRNTIDEIIDKVDQAISSGKCDIENVKSMCSVIESDGQTNELDEKTKMVIEKLRKADENPTPFKNLQEMSTYLKNECASEIPNQRDASCVDAFNETFKGYNIELNENVMSKEVPTDMVLGLVNSKSEEKNEILPVVDSSINDIIENVDEKSTDPLNSPAYKERNENLPIVESFIGNMIDHFDTNAKVPLNSPTYNYIKDQTDATFECVVPPLPGIGKDCSQKVIDCFLAFILSRAREEKGMVYTRFFKEMKCPVMTDNFN